MENLRSYVICFIRFELPSLDICSGHPSTGAHMCMILRISAVSGRRESFGLQQLGRFHSPLLSELRYVSVTRQLDQNDEQAFPLPHPVPDMMSSGRASFMI